VIFLGTSLASMRGIDAMEIVNNDKITRKDRVDDIFLPRVSKRYFV